MVTVGKGLCTGNGPAASCEQSCRGQRCRIQDAHCSLSEEGAAARNKLVVSVRSSLSLGCDSDCTAEHSTRAGKVVCSIQHTAHSSVHRERPAADANVPFRPSSVERYKGLPQQLSCRSSCLSAAPSRDSRATLPVT